jgi:transposase
MPTKRYNKRTVKKLASKNKKEILKEGEFKKKYSLLLPVMNEKQRRLFVASDVLTLGLKITSASKFSGLDRNTIRKGIEELKAEDVDSSRIRRIGGGRKKKTALHPEIRTEIEKLIEPETRGEPECLLRWTTKSLENLSEALNTKGYQVGKNIIAEVLHELGYSLQSNRKRSEGKEDHPDRDKQFHYINDMSKRMIAQNEPVISVDTKKKELIGNYKNAGKELSQKGKPVEVLVHDFIDPEVPKAVPYGVYDISKNQGYVNVGTDHDTSEFAVESIRGWWKKIGSKLYKNSKRLVIFADSGGSNGYRVKLWKVCLQKLANEIEREIIVCHFPSGTSKWNKIEHRLFSFITKNWRGRPLVSYKVIVSLIGSTKTRKGLKVFAKLDKRKYKKGIKISDEIINSLNLKPHAFHPEWNYTISPKK